MAGVPVNRPPKTKATGFMWWADLPHALAYPAAPLKEALDALEANPGNDAARAVARDYAREMLTPVALALGISAGDPLLVENVAFRLAADRRLWNAPAAPAGRPASDKAKRAQKARDVAIFVNAMKDRNHGLTDTDCLRHRSFRDKFRIGETAGRKYLTEGRAQK